MEKPNTSAGETVETVVDIPVRANKHSYETGDTTLKEAASRPEKPVEDAASVKAATSDASAFLDPQEVLRADEMERSHLLARYAIIIIVAPAGLIPVFQSADPLMTKLFCTMLGVSFFVNLWMLSLTSDIEKYREDKIVVGFAIHALTIGSAVVYFGYFSPAPIIAVFITYFIGHGYSQRTAVVFYVIVALEMLLMAVLFISGVASDPGIIHADYRPVSELIAGHSLVQVILAIAFVAARAARKGTNDKVTKMTKAVRAAAHREALFEEARQDLERALAAGGRGRFSGQRLGSFKLGDLLGRGAMGDVYDAIHIKTGQPAAVKLLQSERLKEPAQAIRFLRELEVAVAVEAKNIVGVIEIGGADAELPYLAMERLSGHDLAHWLRAKRRFEPADVVRLVREVGAGITAAGKAGVVHRDLKPQNIFGAEQSDGSLVWKIVDFGVSKLDHSSGTLTQGQLIGTPAYMSPEQACGSSADHRSDLYALAAIAYRAITGHLPFRGGDVPLILHAVLYSHPTRPSALVDVHPDVDSAIAIGMAKKPADRFDSALKLVEALELAFAGQLPAELRNRARKLAPARRATTKGA